MHKITLLQPVMHDVEHRGLHSLLPPQWNAVIIHRDMENTFQKIYGYNSGKAASGRENALFNEAVMCLIPLPN